MAILVAAVICLPSPAAARGIAVIDQDLAEIEGHLHSGEWKAAKAACNRLVDFLIQGYARGEGARQAFGRTFAFRALAESALGDAQAAAWDWSAAERISPDAASIDMTPFGTSARELRETVARVLEPIKDPGGADGTSRVVPPRKISGSPPTFPAGAQSKRFQGEITVMIVISEKGRPRSVEGAMPKDLDEHTALVVAVLERLREWRFRPATVNGKGVKVYYFASVNFRLW